MKKLLFLTLIIHYCAHSMDNPYGNHSYDIVPPKSYGSSKPAFKNEHIRFELWHKENINNKNVWISVITADGEESIPVQLSVGERYISPDRIQQICYGSELLEHCYVFTRNDKIYLTLSNNAIKPQSGTAIRGTGAAAKRFGSVRRALGTSVKSESGVSLHDNITSNEIVKIEETYE